MHDSPSLTPHYALVDLKRVDSVMAEARRRAQQGAEEGTLVWAGEQSAGRTRRGHEWYSPAGNLHCALLLRPDYPRAVSGQLAYVAALAAGSALAGLLAPMTGLRYRWPNDIYLNDLRAGQILLEASPGGADTYDWLAVGLMVNVASHPPNPEPEEFNSVHASGAPEVTAAQVLEDFSRYFLTWINRWAEDGFEPIARHWQQRADGLGEPVEAVLAGRTVRGVFSHVDELGRLVARSDTGEELRVGVDEYFGLGSS